MMKRFFSAALLCGSILAANPAAAADLSFTGSLSDPNQVLLFNFVVGAPSNVTLRTYTYSGGTNAAGTTFAGGGFDPILALFDSTGLLIGQNDDLDTFAGLWDTYLNTNLAAGTYTVSVQAFSNFAIGPNLSDGFQNTGSFNGRTTNWAFDVLNVQAATQIGAVPEPATWAMMLAGFGAVGLGMRRRKPSVKVSYC